MRRYHSIGELPLGGPRRVVTIGAFDGVHLGHQAIVRRAREIATERGQALMAVTFHPNPISVLRPELRTTVLTGPALQAALIERLGVDELLAVPFNRSFARIRADRFVQLLSSAPIGADVVVVGAGFRFGHGAEGTVALMSEVGRTLGLRVESPPLVASPDGKPISSTRVRRLVSLGNVAEVIPLLGRPHAVEGVVVRGAGRGRQIGVPTANLQVAPPNAALPGRGVYAARATLPGGVSRQAAVNVGQAPTFRADGRGAPPLVEAHLLDHDGSDLYDTPMRLELVHRIRDERRFDGPEALVAQIRLDVEAARTLLAGAAGQVGAL